MRRGTTAITKAYRGNTEIKKVYRGTTLIWEDYVPSWKTIHNGLENMTSDPTNVTISNVPAGATIRIRANVYLGGGLWDYNVVVSENTAGGNYMDYDYMDEGTEVFVYGNISWERTSTTNIRFQIFQDYSNIGGYWQPSFNSIEAYY